MMRSSWNHSRETIIFLFAVVALFMVLILRNGDSSSMNYVLHQDPSRAQFEIDQSYVLLLSQAEGSSHLTKPENKDYYNGTLLREFKEILVQNPTILIHNRKSEFHAPAKGNEILHKLLRNKRDGYFVHCCYFEVDSLTIASQLQTVQGWNTLIMEGDTGKYKTLRSIQRSFSLVNAILSDNINVSMDSISQKLKQSIKNNQLSTSVAPYNKQTQDYPIGFVTRSQFGTTSIDWLVLSAQGREMGILKSMIASDCKVQVVSVELRVNVEAIEKLLYGNGYKKWGKSGNMGIFYHHEEFTSIKNEKEQEDMSPLLEKLRQDKMNRKAFQ